MHLDIPNIPFVDCVLDTIGMLSTTNKYHKVALTFICLLMSYEITVLSKTKKVEEATVTYIKEILPKHHTVYMFYRIMEQNLKMTI